MEYLKTEFEEMSPHGMSRKSDLSSLDPVLLHSPHSRIFDFVSPEFLKCLDHNGKPEVLLDHDFSLGSFKISNFFGEIFEKLRKKSV